SCNSSGHGVGSAFFRIWPGRVTPCRTDPIRPNPKKRGRDPLRQVARASSESILPARTVKASFLFASHALRRLAPCPDRGSGPRFFGIGLIEGSIGNDCFSGPLPNTRRPDPFGRRK